MSQVHSSVPVKGTNYHNIFYKVYVNIQNKCDIPADLAAFCKNIHGLYMHPRIYINNTYCDGKVPNIYVRSRCA